MADTLAYHPADANTQEKQRRGSSSSRTETSPEEPPQHKEQAGRTKDGKIELTEEDCYDELGFSFPKWKKWTILSIIFMVQVSMNFNTSLYSNLSLIHI